MRDWIVSIAERLDVFLASEGRMLSRAKAQKAIEDGRVRLNGTVVTKVSLRLQEGDRVSLEDAEEVRESSLVPQDLHIDILYEDDACFVIHKPAGIAVHPGAGMLPNEQTLLNGIAFLFQQRSLPFSLDAVLVHRLDKDTTGCLLVAKNSEAHRALQTQFETRTVSKQYLAIVAGVPAHEEAMIDAPIGRSTSNRTTMSVRGNTAARDAQTSYRILGSANNTSLLLCDLHTGRTHQVRVHLSSIGHPVLGDGTYTSVLADRLRDQFAIRSLCLHAWKLTFASPADGATHAVTAPLPQAFERTLQVLGVAWNG